MGWEAPQISPQPTFIQTNHKQTQQGSTTQAAPQEDPHHHHGLEDQAPFLFAMFEWGLLAFQAQISRLAKHKAAKGEIWESHPEFKYPH